MAHASTRSLRFIGLGMLAKHLKNSMRHRVPGTRCQHPGLVPVLNFLDSSFRARTKMCSETVDGAATISPRVRATHAPYGTRRAPITMIAEAPVTFEPEAVIAQEPDAPDLVPSETSASPIIEPVGASSFPKVLRSRLDRFFADQKHFSQSGPHDVGQDRCWAWQSSWAPGLLCMRSGPVPGSLLPSTF